MTSRSSSARTRKVAILSAAALIVAAAAAIPRIVHGSTAEARTVAQVSPIRSERTVRGVVASPSIHSKTTATESTCYYTETVKSYPLAVKLYDGLYLSVTLSVWQVPEGCAQWQDHATGDTEVEVSVTAPANLFIYPDLSQINVYGWETDAGTNFATANDIYNFPNEAWVVDPFIPTGNWNSIWSQSPRVTTGSNTVYQVTPLTNEDPAAGCLNGVTVADYGTGYPNSYVYVDGGKYTLPDYSVATHDPGKDGTCGGVG